MAVNARTSFQKKVKGKIISIPGTKISVHNSQLLTSTGVSELDTILGGGLPVGSIVLIEEDAYDIYSKVILKLYLAEGVAIGQFVHCISLNEDPYSILCELPSTFEGNSSEIKETDEKMEIAWRYQNKVTHSSVYRQAERKYDLTKPMEYDNIKCIATFWKPIARIYKDSDIIQCTNPLYSTLLENIMSKLTECNVIVSPNKHDSNLLRIAIHSILSPLWGSEFVKFNCSNGWNGITQFFTVLKAIIRSSFAVMMITVPSHLIQDPALISRLYGIVDFAIKLESFQGTKVNPAFKDYHGLFYVKKMSTINSIVPQKLDSLDWAFQLRKTGLSIKRLHLPPELSETVSRGDEEVTQSKSSCMGENLPKYIDF